VVLVKTVESSSELEVIGLIPAGGQATRIAPLPCSKELFPIGFRRTDKGDSRPKVVAHYLLEKMRFAGIDKAYFILRPGKWDIPAYFGDGSLVNMNLAYLTLGPTFGVPFTIDQAYPFVKQHTVAFGFPDILVEGDDVFARLLSAHRANDADVTLGLFPANDRFSKEDRVVFGSENTICEIVLRPLDSELKYSWAIAAWGPNFSSFLRDYVREKRQTAEKDVELSAGHAIEAGILAGISVSGVVLNESPYLDIGTPEGLRKAISVTREKSPERI
jgi:glucose-1-phosphate thymidylyltransferase